MQNFQCAEYVHFKFFFVIVVADCLLLVRLVPALVAYCKTSSTSLKVYFIFKLVTFFLYLAASIGLMVLVWHKVRQAKIEQTVHLEFQRLANDYKSSRILLILNILYILFDAISCYLLSLVLRYSTLREKQLLRKHKNRAMMTKNHKGSVRIDTPPPNVDIEQISRS